VVVLDRAGWHGAGDLVVPENITLLPLPSYAPELNPVEKG
jgi:transposase